jgi:hypothetical protein
MAAVRNASATLLLDEPFNYADGPLEAVSSETWTNNSGLPGLIGINSGRVLLSQTAGAEGVGTAIAASGLNTIYASFTVNFSARPAGGGGAVFAQFRAAGALRARVFARTNGAAAGKYRLAIANAAGAPSVTFPADLGLSTNHTVVIRYNVLTGASTLWVNPGNAEQSASVTAIDPVIGTNIVWFDLAQSLSTTNGMGDLAVDSLKIANSFPEVTAVWDNRWTALGDSKWENASQWSLGTPSNSQTGPLIANAPSKAITIDSFTAQFWPTSLAVSNLTVSAPDASTTNTLRLDNVGANYPLVISNVFTLGSGGALTLIASALQLPGLASRPPLSPGLYLDGPVMLSTNASISASNVSILAGNFSGSTNGAITVDEGTMVAGKMVLGNAEGALGSLRLHSGLLSFPGGTNLIVGGASNAVGALTVNGGLLDASSSLVVIGGSGSGSATASGGEIRSWGLTLGKGGPANLLVQGGKVTVGSDLLVAPTASCTGLVSITSGTLTATNGIVQIGPAGSGQMNISGGNAAIKELRLGGTTNGAEGSLHLTGGHLKVLSLISVNAFGMDGGDLDGSGGTCLLGNGHNAAMWVSDGTATNIGTLYVGYSGGYTGTLSLSGGMLWVLTNAIVGDCVNGAVGNVTLDGGVLNVMNFNSALLDVRNGTITLNPGGSLWVDQLVITNSCGHFLNNGGTLVMNSAPLLDANMDADGDGLPNGWEQAHELDPLSVLGDNGAFGDPDGDGQSNLAEYLAGTDPKNADSVFRVYSAKVTGQDVRLDWTVVGGHSYVVQIATNSTGGISNLFTDLSPVIAVGGSGEGTANYTHAGGATKRGAYYRVRLAP